METLPASFTVLSEEVRLFEAYERGYYALLRRGPRLDILRVFPFQPVIEDFDDYATYLFLQTVQGFFILRQNVRQGCVSPWFVNYQLHPNEPDGFFAFAAEHRDALAAFVRAAAPRLSRKNSVTHEP